MSGVLAIVGGLSPISAQVSTPTTLEADHERVDVLGAFEDSLKLLLIEHGIRIALQEKTRRELDGPFWRDYRRSVRIPHQWEDSDAWWVNYIGHPIHGAAAGYIWLNHDPGAPTEIGLNRHYWATRGQAAAWIGTYSLQFEFGPLSEASIGNVGMRSETTGWVDHVVTPLGAFGLVVAEDVLDRFVVKWLEARATNRIWRACLRLIFNPARTLANAASGRLPWYREDRALGWK
jgi:hypothetical protein